MSASHAAPAASAADLGDAGWDASNLLGALVDDGVVDASDLPRLLGPERHELTVARLEAAVSRAGLIRDADLLAVKERVSGQPAADPSRMPPTADLRDEAARRLLAVSLRGDGQRPTVAFVHDTPTHVRAAENELGVEPGQLDVRVTTVRTLKRLLDAVRRSATAVVERPLPDIWRLLDEFTSSEATDLHLTVGDQPAWRLHGDVERLGYEPVTSPWLQEVTGTLLDTDPNGDGPVEVSATIPYGPFRLRTMLTRGRGGLTLAARKLAERIPPMEYLGVPPAAQRFADLERGMVLVVGQTSSGKSTTLAALLQTVLRTRKVKVVTLEDPVEYRLEPGLGMVDQRELGRDFSSFAEAVVQSTRQDPDVILIGEMRDPATVRAALEAAGTGHLVMSTLHSTDAPSAVTRITDFFGADEVETTRSALAYSLQGVVAQTLLKSATAGRGRVAAFEVMVVNGAVRNLIREGNPAQIRGTMATGSRAGMQTMEQALARLVRTREVMQQEAEFRANRVDEFHHALDS